MKILYKHAYRYIPLLGTCVQEVHRYLPGSTRTRSSFIYVLVCEHKHAHISTQLNANN